MVDESVGWAAGACVGECGAAARAIKPRVPVPRSPPARHRPAPAAGPTRPARPPVGDVLRQVQLAEGGQQPLNPLLKALGGARVARRRHDRHVHVAAAAGARPGRRAVSGAAGRWWLTTAQHGVARFRGSQLLDAA